jgi:hypothetical protein
MFPIVLIAHNQATRDIVIASSAGFNLIGRDGDPVRASVWAVAFLRKFLLIFQDTDGGRVILDFYRADLTYIKSTPFPYLPLVTASMTDVCMVSCENAFTRIRVVDRPADIELDSVHLQLTLHPMGMSIGGVFPISDADYLIYYPQKLLVKSNAGSSIAIPDVKACWYVSSPPAVFMHNKVRTMIFMGGIVEELDICPQVADGVCCYSTPEQTEFGRLELQSVDYPSRFLARLATKTISFQLSQIRSGDEWITTLSSRTLWSTLSFSRIWFDEISHMRLNGVMDVFWTASHDVWLGVLGDLLGGRAKQVPPKTINWLL